MLRKFYSILLITILHSCGFVPSEEEERLFIKQYDLLKLDGDTCLNCIVDVKEDHIYKILKDGEEVGDGKWDLSHPIDIPGFVLELENGPGWMVYDSDTEIDYIDRRQSNKSNF
ncbi:MAG: hypothetical protein KJ941_07640 [Bacteroidetes bacterium]|nr:hypothetical protein [Bacteroidota bacterium]